MNLLRWPFTITVISTATAGARPPDLFQGGETLNPAISGGVITMGDIHRVYVPSALR